MTTSASLLRVLFLVLVMGVLSSAHSQTVTPLTPTSSQNSCCVCAASNGSTFRVPAQGGSQACSTACAASGGKATGSTTACYQGSASYPAAKYDGPTQCMKSIDGGNCRGNNWCHCGVVRVAVVMDDGKEYPDKDAKTGGEVHIHVGQTLKFHGIMNHFGGTESGPRVVLQKSAKIEVFGPDSNEKHVLDMSGDATPAEFTLPVALLKGLATYTEFATYTFDKAGTYTVALHVWGAYKWNGDDGSCSYECENGPGTLAAQKTDGQNWPLSVVVEANADKPRK